MSPDLIELLFEVLNFGFLAGGLAWLLFRPVRAALAAEAQQKVDREAALAQKEAAAKQADADLNARRATFEDDLQKQAAQVLDAAATDAKKSRADAAADLDARRAAWDAEQATRLAEAARAEAHAAAAVAGGAVRRLLEAARGPDLDLALTRTALAASSSKPSGTVTVELASPPSDVLQGLLAENLPTGFTMRVRPELGAGIRIMSDSGLVDVTAAGLAADAAEGVALELTSPTGTDA